MKPSRKTGPALLAAGLAIAFAQAAHAGWREDLGTFRIGMLADPGTGRLVAGLSDIRKAFSAALGMPVQVFVARDYAALIDAHATSRVDYAVYSATAYATARRLCDCVEPLVARQGTDGDIGIRAVLIVRKSALDGDGGVGKARIALPGGDSVAGALLPAVALDGPGGVAGLSRDRLIEASGDGDAVDRLAKGTADGLFGWSSAGETSDVMTGTGTFAQLAEAGIEASDLKLEWRSDLLRYGPHAVRSDLDGEAKALLRAFLTGLVDDKPDIQELLSGSQDDRFVAVTADDYKLADDMVGSIAAN
ncbi:MAG: PhnD/SsuA/transferrin family substrate-binding protein [Rhizobiaceae bacterium]